MVLQCRILGLRVRLRTPQMVEILTPDVRLGVISGGGPDLGQVGLIDIVGRARAAHPGRHPAGLQRVREDAGPTPGNGEGERRIMELALGIGRRAVAATLFPEDVVEIGVGVVMHAGTEIDEAFRPLDQRGQNVGRQCVDREDMRQTIGCDAMALPIADSGIVEAAAKPRSCRLYRPQDGFQQVVVVARASLDRERFDLGGWNPGLAHCPLHALDNGESIFVLTEQGDTDVWIFAVAIGLSKFSSWISLRTGN